MSNDFSAVRKRLLQQRPPHPIESVDNALRLLQLLRDGGELRITDAARELGIAPSTAHRLMAMLVYRGFALQDERRRYVAGPALGSRAIGAPWLHELRALALAPMQALCTELNETINLVVRVGVNIRFLASIEAQAVLRIGDRTGTVMPAYGASSGKVLLACESEETLQRLYRGRAAHISGAALDQRQFRAFLSELASVRRQGYALSREETETGVAAVGVLIRGPGGVPIAALSVATPIARLDGVLQPGPMQHIFSCRDEISSAAASLKIDVQGPIPAAPDRP